MSRQYLFVDEATKCPYIAAVMTPDEFRKIRERLDPSEFADFLPNRKEGPGRPPSGEVTQAALGKRLGKSARQVMRYENGATPVPPLVAEAMERLDPKRRRPRRK